MRSQVLAVISILLIASSQCQTFLPECITDLIEFVRDANEKLQPEISVFNPLNWMKLAKIAWNSKKVKDSCKSILQMIEGTMSPTQFRDMEASLPGKFLKLEKQCVSEAVNMLEKVKNLSNIFKNGINFESSTTQLSSLALNIKAFSRACFKIVKLDH